MVMWWVALIPLHCAPTVCVQQQREYWRWQRSNSQRGDEHSGGDEEEASLRQAQPQQGQHRGGIALRPQLCQTSARWSVQWHPARRLAPPSHSFSWFSLTPLVLLCASLLTPPLQPTASITICWCATGRTRGKTPASAPWRSWSGSHRSTRWRTRYCNMHARTIAVRQRATYSRSRLFGTLFI